MSAVHRSHQREGEVEDVAVEQRAFLLQQHGQQLEEKHTLVNNWRVSILITSIKLQQSRLQCKKQTI